MKWPKEVVLVRHAKSVFNALDFKKSNDPVYQEFVRQFHKDPYSKETRSMAESIKEKFSLGVGDHNTPLDEKAKWQAVETGRNLRTRIPLPDTIFVSPYDRTKQTLELMATKWPDLNDVNTIEEERIREKDHGLALLYNDRMIFGALHPEQIELRRILGSYWYRFPNGENIPDVKERARSWFGTLIRDYAEQNILAVTHHLMILSIRANMERLTAQEFLTLDKTNKPENCSVTIYEGNPNLGKDGKMELLSYNLVLY